MDAHTSSAIKQKYTVALMSNHKWKKFFTVMAETSPELRSIEYHFTDTSKVFYGSAPSITQVYETTIDNPIKDASGPVEYKHIESLSIPRIHKSRAYEKSPYIEQEQNIDRLLEALKKVGQFPITNTETSVIIHGYKVK